MHHIGARMVSDLLDQQGWDVLFLGSNTPPDSLLAMVEHVRPNLLGVSVTMPENLPGFHETVAAANRDFPELPVIAGGQAWRLAGETGEPVIPGARYLESVDRIDEYAP